MPDALFGEAFRDYFLNADAVSHEEFLCEQAFLLRKCVGWTEKESNTWDDEIGRFV